MICGCDWPVPMEDGSCLKCGGPQAYHLGVMAAYASEISSSSMN